MNAHVRAVVRKEFLELRRDPITLWIAAFVPVILLIVFAYAIRLDVGNVRTAVVDLDGSAASRALVDALRNTGDFVVAERPGDASSLMSLMDAGRVRLGIVIPAGFERDIARGDTARVQTLIDGSYSSTAVIIRNEVDGLILQRNRDLAAAAMGGRPAVPLRIEPRVWYNPSLRSETFVVPGLFAVILMAFPPLLTVLAVVREKESGSIQQIYVSPIRPWEFIAGKLTAYMVVALVELATVMLLGWWWFDIPFRGSPVILVVASLLYVLCTVGIGLLVSTVTRTQLVAMLLALVITVMPSFLFSGFMYPISSMAPAVQWYSRIFPAQYFVEITRGTFLKGVGWAELTTPLLVLAVYTTIVFAIAATRFRKRVARSEAW